MVAGISQYKPPPAPQEEGEPGHANEHGGDRVRGELLDIASYALIGTVTGSPVQDEQRCTRDHGHSEQLPTQGYRWLRNHKQERDEH